MNNNFDKLSYDLTKSLSKETKKNNGIFFTPYSTININIDLIKPYFTNIKTILEPSCGSCQFINKLLQINNHFNITAIELNKTIFDSIINLQNNNLTIFNQDFLDYNFTSTYDLIIGNPPYFVIPKNIVDKKYFDYFDGRPNIFILFIIKSLSLLNKNGILSFILPKNFTNSHYYDKTRKYILNNFKILHIIYSDSNYIETKQDTIILIIQNTTDNNTNSNYSLQTYNYTIFAPPQHILELKQLYLNSTTLYNLKFSVNVGTIVWNQHKDILTNDPSNTLLIYNSDIKSNKLQIQKYKNPQKKNYINKPGYNKPCLLINRGYGKGTYNFQYLLIDGTFDYLVENHLISIKHNQTISNSELIQLYNKIIYSLNNHKTTQFINLYFGNNAINTTELLHILPIYL